MLNDGVRGPSGYTRPLAHPRSLLPHESTMLPPGMATHRPHPASFPSLPSAAGQGDPRLAPSRPGLGRSALLAGKL